MSLRRVFPVLASLLAAILFAGLNLAAGRWLAPARLDLTDGGLFTLSRSAETVVKRLAEPVELELVYARAAGTDYPAIRSHAGRIRELLAAIAARSGGKVRVRETDPEPFSEAEDRILGAGIQPLSDGEGDPILLGLIGRNAVDDVVVIPFFAPDREELLEYDIVRLIAQLDNPDPPRVAVFSGLRNFRGDGTSPDDPLILREMARSFRVEPLAVDFATLPAAADLLVLIHPTFSDWQAYIVDQFLVQGGRAFVAVDPYSAAAAESGRSAGSNLGPLARTLGAAVSAGLVSDPTLALPVEVDLGAGRKGLARNSLLLGVSEAGYSDTDPVTADLSRAVNLRAAGVIEASDTLGPEGSVRLHPVLETSDKAMLAPADAANQPFDQIEVAGAASKRTVAARISGRLQSAFEGSPPPPAAPVDPVEAALQAETLASLPAHMPQGTRPAEVILLADVDALDERLFTNPADGLLFADNAAFVLNALDNLSGDPALLALRSRAAALRPMKRLEQASALAQARLADAEPALNQRLAEINAAIERARASTPATDMLRVETGPELAAWRAEAASIRAELRELRRTLRRDLDRIETVLALLNVWTTPALVGLVGVAVFFLRRRSQGAVRQQKGSAA